MSDNILKAAAPGGQKVLKHELFEAADLARGIVEQARQEAARIRADAVEAGRAEGLAEWHQKVREAVSARDAYLKASEEDVVRLAVRVAEKILGEALKAEPERVCSVVGEALRGLRRERSITVVVHPDHLEIVRSRLRELEDQAGGDCRIRVASNTSVDLGGCRIETELGSVDARLETQLRCLEEALLREVRE